MLITNFIQDATIEEKINNAPNSSYEIGVFIGSMLPFIALVIIAYLIYKHNKNKIKNE